MQIKKHYKLYKDGKQWCCMAIATLAVTAGLMVGGNTVKADTTTNQPTTTQVVAQNQSLATQEQAAQAKDNGDYGYLDSANVVNNGELQVSGWQATNQAANKPNRYVVAYDSTTGTELGRTQVTNNVARPDVQRAYPNVVNAGQSGYSTTMNKLNWQGVKSANDQIQIVSRYSSGNNGEGQKADHWSQAINLDKGNYAYLDNFGVNNNQLQVSGWNATNQALGHSNHYIILYDKTAGHEITRQKVSAVNRPDVARAYPQVIDAKDAGFSTAFSLKNVDLTHEYQVISRYSNAANGEGDYVDYWLAPRRLAPTNTSNQGSLDSFNISNGQLTVSGWHATDLSQIENNHYLILFDNTNHRQVASIKATIVNRPDVARAYRNVQTANRSGFTGNFGNVPLTAGHSYSIVSRYSTLNGGNGDNGQSQYTDFWSSPVVLNQSAYSIDSFTSNNGKLNLTGWMASDGSIGRQNAYVIFIDNGKERDRAKVVLSARHDVAKAYPSVYNSANSGFNVTFNVDPSTLTGNVQFVLRFTNSSDGNSNYSDQWTKAYPTNVGNFDTINVTAHQITVSGWHASTQAANKPYEYLIVLDSNNHELYRQQITNKNIQRRDVKRAYPYLSDAASSGYTITLTIPSNVQGKTVKFIHRLTDDPAGNGNCVDVVSTLIDVNLPHNVAAYPIYTVDVYSGSSDSIIRDPHAQGVIIKATQGTYYVNPKCNHQYALAKSEGKLLGLYHYAGGGDPVAEADTFINSISNYVGSAILILDWESYQNSAWGNPNWARSFANEVPTKTGVWPLIYSNESGLSQVANCASNCGLWVAKYPSMNWNSWTVPNMPVSSGAFSQITGWQYTGGDMDRSIFYLNGDGWMRLAKPTNA